MNVSIICSGRMKEDYYKAACAEYIKRIGAFANITVTEINEERLSDKPSEAEIRAALAKEGKALLAAAPPQSAVAALCIEGKQLDSPALADKINDFAINGKSNIAFLIGSSYGLSEEVKSRADIRLSMSKMTFPHRLARVMLLEQIYRALSISAGRRYHK